MNSKGTNSPRSSPSCFHFSVVAIDTARTVASSLASFQSMRVVQPIGISYFCKRWRARRKEQAHIESFHLEALEDFRL